MRLMVDDDDDDERKTAAAAAAAALDVPCQMGTQPGRAVLQMSCSMEAHFKHGALPESLIVYSASLRIDQLEVGCRSTC